MLYTILSMAGNQAQSGAAPQQSNPVTAFLPFILMFVVIWFFMIRPQSKKQKELQNMLNNVQVNDWVLTNGGIIGKITSIKPDKNIIVLEIDENNHTRVEFQKSAIVSVLSKDNKTV